MEIVEFKDYPNTETPLNSHNLNRMQNNIKTELTNIEQEGIIASPTEPIVNRRKVWLQNVNNNEKIHILNDDNVYEEFIKKHEEIYSTEEQTIGKWIDGKTLYTKVLVKTNVTTSGRVFNVTIADSSNLDKAWFMGGYAYYAQNGYQYPLDSNIGITLQVSAENNVVTIINDNGSGRTFDVYLIIYYTKNN